ncbi:XRE family transcriptional regulator [Streptococcus pluranimalium]|uniref:S24 family peptidase n=1 Tax=Streptococcus pluranimalium TaxID=82348 RepID=UPI0039EC9755
MNEIELKRIIEYQYGSVRAFAIENDIPYTTMRSILERGILNAKAETIFKICRILNIRPESIEGVDFASDSSQPIFPSVSPTPKVLHLDCELKEPRHSEWISNGEELLKKQTAEQNTVGNNVVQFPKRHSYDYYDQALSAGTGQYLNDVQVEQIELPVDIDADFVVPIYGDSMEPDYHSGDYVFVKLSVDLSDGDIGVFEYYGDAYIKQLLINKSGAFLHSLNPEYPDIPIDADSDFRIIGEVVGKYSEK